MQKVLISLILFLLCIPAYGVITQLDSENADRDLTSIVTILTDTPDASSSMLCQAYIVLGDGAKDLGGAGGLFEFTLTIGGQTIQPNPEYVSFGTEIRAAAWTSTFPVPANTEVIIRVRSPDAADTDVDVTAYLYDVFPLNSSAGVVEADSVKLSGDATAADNLEATYDGTGYAEDSAPSTQIQLTTVSGGVSVAVTANDSVVTEGEETLTYAATATDDGNYYEVASDAISDDIDFYLVFNTGDGMNLPVSFHLHGRYEDNNAPANSTLLIQSYNFNIADWDTIDILSDTSGDIDLILPLHIHDVDSEGGGEGDVRIRFKLSATEVSQVILIDHATVNYVSGGLTAAAIWANPTRILTALDEDDTTIDLDTAIQASAVAALEANHLDHLFAVPYAPASPPGVGDALLNELVEDAGGGVSRWTDIGTVSGLENNVITAASINANAITAAKLATDAVDEIVDAVWDEAIGDHVGASTFGKWVGVIYDYWDSLTITDGNIHAVPGNI